MNKGNSNRNKTKTAKVLGLFMAAVLAAGSGGCTSSGHKHIDSNSDGYCDEDGESVGSGSGGYDGSHHYYGNHGRSYPATTGGGDATSSHNGISTATSPKGGIGSHSTGSAGG